MPFEINIKNANSCSFLITTSYKLLRLRSWFAICDGHSVRMYIHTSYKENSGAQADQKLLTVMGNFRETIPLYVSVSCFAWLR